MDVFLLRPLRFLKWYSRPMGRFQIKGGRRFGQVHGLSHTCSSQEKGPTCKAKAVPEANE